jgi:hypothetical protein
MAKKDPRITKYIQGRAPFARPILRRLRSVLSTCPGLEETIKWGMPTYTCDGKIVCGFAGFKAHCALWFKNGRAVVGKKPKEAMGNFGRITELAGLPPARELKGYVRKAVKRVRDDAR